MEDQQGPTKFIDPRIQEVQASTTNLYNNAIEEFGLKMPLAFVLYNQIRYYEDFGKLKIGYSIQGKEALANQFGVTVKQIEKAYDHLTNTYKLGSWVISDSPIFRRVKKVWVSNVRQQRMSLEDTLKLIQNSHSMGENPQKLPQHGSKTPTAWELQTEVPPLSESNIKVNKKVNSDSRLTSLVDIKEKNNDTSDLDDFIVDVLTTAGFSCCKTNVVDARPSAKEALKSGKPKEDILKAAKNIKSYTGDIKCTVRSPFQSTSFWMNQGQVKKGTIIT